VKRAPARPLVLLPDALADTTGPAFGDGHVSEAEADLTGQHDGEPVGVLTLGRLRLRRIAAFRRSAAPAEADAIASPALLAGIGLARPPRLVATFSLWRSAAAMREYAVGPGGSHSAAVSADRAQPFHHESAFVRFRPYASSGSWDGRDPLAGPSGAPAS